MKVSRQIQTNNQLLIIIFNTVANHKFKKINQQVTAMKTYGKKRYYILIISFTKVAILLHLKRSGKENKNLKLDNYFTIASLTSTNLCW